MPASMPKEYTDEMNQNFYESLARPIEERTNVNVGKARSEALARGMEGDPFESLGVASARNSGANQLGDLWSGIAMQGADKARQERMVGEGQAFSSGEAQKTRDWTSAENDESRAFSEKMSNLAYDQWRGKEALANRRDYQSEIWNTGAN